MAQETKGLCLCPLEGVIDTISKKWALLIIHVLGNTSRVRFSELMKELDGISPKTLTDTLVVFPRSRRGWNITSPMTGKSSGMQSSRSSNGP